MNTTMTLRVFVVIAFVSRHIAAERTWRSAALQFNSSLIQLITHDRGKQARARKQSRFNQSEMQVLCKVRRPTDANGDIVSVILRGEHRYLSFGTNIDEGWQTRVHCPNVACLASAIVADDAAKCPPCPCDQKGAGVDDDMYTNGPLINVVMPFCGNREAGSNVDILMVGLGGGILHRHILQVCPKSTRLRTIEYDPRVVSLAERYFGLVLEKNSSEIQVGDAREILMSMSSDARNGHVFDNSSEHFAPGLGDFGWDLVVVDCFNDEEIPDSCKHPDFLNAVRDVLKPGGAVVQHVYHDWSATVPEDSISQKKEFHEIVRNYNDVFGRSMVNIQPFPREVSIDESLIVARR